MTNTEGKKINNSSKLNKEEIEFKIEIATQTLERNIKFIENCDNKSSIVLAAIGLLLTIIFSSNGINIIISIMNNCFNAKNFCSIGYLICFALSVFYMGLGVFDLGSVLVAYTSEKTLGRRVVSRIFFTGIKKNKNEKAYRQEFYKMSKKELLDDLINQIYINAIIASLKYEKYNRGIRRAWAGFVCLITVLLIGIYVY